MNNQTIDLRLGRVSETKLLYWVTITCLPLFFIFDGVSKILFTYAYDFHRASLIIRIGYEILFVTLVLALINNLRTSILIILVFLFFTFLLGQITLGSSSFGENLITFNKYLFVFIAYAAIYKLQQDAGSLNRCIDVLEKIFVINSIAVLLGPLTGFQFLKTYVNADYRHGYMGFILAQNEATLFYFIAVSLAYYRKYILGMPGKKFFVILLASFLLGTKGIYLFLALLFIFHSLFFSQRKLLLLTLFGIFLWAFISFATSEQGRLFLVYFYNENVNRDWVSMLLSGRDILLQNNFFGQTKEWTYLNYLVGGQDVLRYNTELDFVDLFLFFGFVGSAGYVILYFSTIFQFRKTFFTTFFIGCYFMLAFFGGHFFSSAVNGIYLCLFCMYIYQTQHGKGERSLHQAAA